MKINFKCEMFIDQNKKIGNDPVGYACSNRAEFEFPSGMLVCEECLKIWKDTPQRVTFPRPPYGRLVQTELLKFAIQSPLDLLIESGYGQNKTPRRN